jgi:hypothetical protein
VLNCGRCGGGFGVVFIHLWWWEMGVAFICWWWWVLGVWYLDAWRRWRWWVEVVLVKWLLERRLLLTKDLNSVLELREPCPFSINVLPSGLGRLCCCLSPCDGFMFLLEPLNLLPNSGQLLLFCSFVFKGLIFPVLHVDLFELCTLLNDLN